MKKIKFNFISRIFVVVFIIQMLNGLSSTMTNPVFTEYLLSKGVSMDKTGYISSAISYISMLFTPFAGYLSDCVSQKKMMLVAYGVTGMCLIGYVFTSNYLSILLVRVLHGIAFAMTTTLGLTYATSFVPIEQLSSAVSSLSIGSLLSSMFSPVLGSGITDRFGVNVSFVVAALLSFIALIMIVILPEDKTAKENEKRELPSLNDLFSKRVLIYMILISFFSFGNGLISYYLRDMGKERNIENIALFFTVYSFSLVFFKQISGRIHDSKGIAYIVYPAFIINALVMVILSKADLLWPVLVAAVMKAMSQGCATSAMQVESVKISDEDKRGAGASTCLVGQNIGNTIGPILGSQLIVSYGYEKTYVFASAVMLLGDLLFFLNRKKVFMYYEKD